MKQNFLNLGVIHQWCWDFLIIWLLINFFRLSLQILQLGNEKFETFHQNQHHCRTNPFANIFTSTHLLNYSTLIQKSLRQQLCWARWHGILRLWTSLRCDDNWCRRGDDRNCFRSGDVLFSNDFQFRWSVRSRCRAIVLSSKISCFLFIWHRIYDSINI